MLLAPAQTSITFWCEALNPWSITGKDIFSPLDKTVIKTVTVLWISNKVQGLLVYSLLRIIVQFYWLFSELEFQQVAPLT